MLDGLSGTVKMSGKGECLSLTDLHLVSHRASLAAQMRTAIMTTQGGTSNNARNWVLVIMEYRLFLPTLIGKKGRDRRFLQQQDCMMYWQLPYELCAISHYQTMNISPRGFHLTGLTCLANLT